MDILKYAMQIEKEGEAHYRKLAEQTDSSGMKRILTELADSEVEHFEVFKAFRENVEVPGIDEGMLPNIKEIFSKMRPDGAHVANEDEIGLYRAAQVHEKKSQEFYQQKADETDDPALKEMLVKIAREEGKHYQVLEGIIDFLSSPTQWLESAEWNRTLDEY
ncbi:MAG: ferritin family protein [Sedimenticola sp.]